jgi:hypothetical protein
MNIWKKIRKLDQNNNQNYPRKLPVVKVTLKNYPSYGDNQSHPSQNND